MKKIRYNLKEKGWLEKCFIKFVTKLAKLKQQKSAVEKNPVEVIAFVQERDSIINCRKSFIIKLLEEISFTLYHIYMKHLCISHWPDFGCYTLLQLVHESIIHLSIW